MSIRKNLAVTCVNVNVRCIFPVSGISNTGTNFVPSSEISKNLHDIGFIIS